MNNNLVATLGEIKIALDISDPGKPVVMTLTDSANAQRLAGLISSEPDAPLDIDWLDADHPDGTVIRMIITSAEDRRIADMINALLALYNAIPDHVRNETGRRL